MTEQAARIAALERERDEARAEIGELLAAKEDHDAHVNEYEEAIEERAALQAENARLREDLRRLVNCPPSWVHSGRPRWSCVGIALSRGSTHAVALCKEFGEDPDATSEAPAGGEGE